MGYYTWTDASVIPRTNTLGEFYKRDKIAYGGYAKMVLPDNSCLETEDYDGYGNIGGRDVHEILTEWNREHLGPLMEKIQKELPLWKCLVPVTTRYQESGEEAAQAYVDALHTDYIFLKEWKRHIGILLDCELEADCFYPLKITKKKKRCTYAELHPSYNTQ